MIGETGGRILGGGSGITGDGNEPITGQWSRVLSEGGVADLDLDTDGASKVSRR